MSSLREDVGEQAKQGLIRVDAECCVLAADDQACRVLGLDHVALRGRPLPIDAVPGEQRYVRPDGTVAWLLVATAADGDGMRVELRDVTAARTFAEEERRVAGRGQPAVEGSWVLDVDGRTIAIAPTAASLLGYRPDEMRGRSPREFVHPADADALDGALARRRDGVRESYEIRWRHSDGAAIWAQMAAAPIRDADGTFAGSFALFTDLTDRRLAEEQLARRARQQEAIAQLGKDALRGDDVAKLEDVAVRMVADVLGVEYAGVLAISGDRLSQRAIHGLPAGAARDLELRARDVIGLAEMSLLEGEPMVVADWDERDDLTLPAYAVELGVRGTVAAAALGRRLHGIVAAARTRPWTPHDDEVRFLESVGHVLAAVRDRFEAEVAGRHRALHDPLTGLPNRTLALDRLAQAQRHTAAQVAVMAVDVDRFKRVNDTFGVGVGDEVVRAVGERLRELAPPTDTVARLSGDKFAVICGDAELDTTATLAARIIECLHEPIVAVGEEFALTASVGVAIGSEDDAAGDLLRDADAALDRAKAAGRDRFELFDRELRTRAVERVQLERDLRHAAARGELFVAHQPIVSVVTGAVTGTEALVRWRHPTRGVVPPGEFIGIAEESGLIAEVGAWVLRRACADVAARHGAGHQLTCHVNLSPRQAVDPRLPDFVAEVLAETGLPAEALVLELTESALMEAGEGPMGVMQALRALGVRLVLDDFGTGYSSLARLRTFPVDGLKIDRSFVSTLEGDDPQDALLCSAMVEMSRALGLTVVAEGVETQRQLDMLARIGCRYAQGFFLARPGDVAQLDAMLA